VIGELPQWHGDTEKSQGREIGKKNLPLIHTGDTDRKRWEGKTIETTYGTLLALPLTCTKIKLIDSSYKP